MILGRGRLGLFAIAAMTATVSACGSTVEQSAATGGVGGAAIGAAAGGPVGALVGAGAGAAAGGGVEMGQQQGQLPPEPGDTSKPQWRATQAPPATAQDSQDMGALPPRWEERPVYY